MTPFAREAIDSYRTRSSREQKKKITGVLIGKTKVNAITHDPYGRHTLRPKQPERHNCVWPISQKKVERLIIKQ